MLVYFSDKKVTGGYLYISPILSRDSHVTRVTMSPKHKSINIKFYIDGRPVANMGSHRGGEMKVFISGPYTANHPRKVLENVNKAIDIGIELMKLGHDVYIPHLSHFIHLRPQCPFEYEEYLKNDLAWLEVSDAIYFIGSSKGANLELDKAKQLGLNIITSLDKERYNGKRRANNSSGRIKFKGTKTIKPR